MHALNINNLFAFGILEEAYQTYEETIEANDYAQHAPVNQKRYKSREDMIRQAMREPLNRFVRSNRFIFSDEAKEIDLDSRDIMIFDGISGMSLSHYNNVKAVKKHHLPTINTFFDALESVICQKMIRDGEFQGISRTFWLEKKAIDMAMERMDDRINRLAKVYRSQRFRREQCTTTLEQVVVPNLIIFKSLWAISCNVNKHKVIPNTTRALLVNEKKYIDLPTFKCLTCGRTFIGEQSLKLFVSEYGLPLVSREYDSSYEIDYSSFGVSELYTYGYNVRQEGMPKEERRALLICLLETGKMKKFDIVRDIEKAIKLFENRPQDALAVHKWREDLDFLTSLGNPVGK